LAVAGGRNSGSLLILLLIVVVYRYKEQLAVAVFSPEELLIASTFDR
jgi:hypothetical protein